MELENASESENYKRTQRELSEFKLETISGRTQAKSELRELKPEGE